MRNPESINVLRHLAGKPGHDEVKADLRQLLTTERRAGGKQSPLPSRCPMASSSSARKMVRDALAEVGVAERISALIAELLNGT